MRPLILSLSLILALLFAGQAAAIDVYEFKNSEQEALYQQLTKELRCLVCQNQNLADSDAGLAKDLKDQVPAPCFCGFHHWWCFSWVP